MATRTPPSPSSLAVFGGRVRACRHDRGLSQEALGAASGLHWTFVGQVERGQRNLSLNNLLKLAAALDIDPGELVAGLRPPSS
jgi:transcriptional regulator with XRE-family HTH domain